MRGGVLIGCLLLVMSCKTSPESIRDIGFDYFPLKVGAYQIYAVDETQITQSVEQHFTYELKTKLVDSIQNQEGGYSYIIQRQKRATADLPWENLDSWTSFISNRQALEKEGNTIFAKVTFPIAEGLVWDGNAFNSLGGEQTCGENKDRPCDTYKLKDVGREFALTGGPTFPETLTIVQNDNADLIVKQDVRKEIYAKEIGMIYKESVVLEYCTSPACLGKQQVTTGLRYKQVIKEYGVE